MNATNSTQPSTVVVLGIPFNNVTFAEAVEWVHQRILSGKPGYIATANLDFVKLAWEDPELQRILLEADLVVADGFPIVWLSRLFGPPLKERVTGSDLIPMLAEMSAAKGHSLFLLGGAPGVGEKASQALQARYPGVTIAGQYSPPLADVISMDHAGILEKLNAAKPDILLIAFGAPKQEKFANLHVNHWSIPVSIGVGGTLDFLAGTQIRAPRLVQRLYLEWLWRLSTAPRRLAKRYWDDLIFLLATCRRLVQLRLQPDRPCEAEPAPAPGSGSGIFRISYQPTHFDLNSLCSIATAHSIALDIRGCSWLSSAELGPFLQLAKACRQHDRRLILLHPGTRVKRLLTTCRLSAYLDLADSEHDVAAILKAAAPNGRVIEQDGNRLLIETPGELTAANLSGFKAVIEPALARSPSHAKWVVDLQNTRFLDSSALGLFAAWHKRAAQNEISLKFQQAQPAVSRTFRIAKLDAWLNSSLS